MRTLIGTICLLMCLLPATPLAADEVGSSGHWLDRIYGEVIALFDAVGGALVPTGEPIATSAGEDEKPDTPQVPLSGEEPGAGGEGGPLD